MIGGVQKKILVTEVNGEFVLDEAFAELTGMNTDHSWQLTRKGDNLTKLSTAVKWLEWDDDGVFKANHDSIAIGRSLMMSPFNISFTWKTTEVIEIISNDRNTVEFKTLNSTYKLEKLWNQK
jgi:hypothetical protein